MESYKNNVEFSTHAKEVLVVLILKRRTVMEINGDVKSFSFLQANDCNGERGCDGRQKGDDTSALEAGHVAMRPRGLVECIKPLSKSWLNHLWHTNAHPLLYLTSPLGEAMTPRMPPITREVDAYAF
ncbi:hypothetical protein GW17_00058091 [Ensete ventricosum]|nr:hypothetical protein GW17_00058091 [Ensete ventricosum]